MVLSSLWVAALLSLRATALTAPTFSCRSGAIGAGGDLYIANMTLVEAKNWCANSPACGGFTVRVASKFLPP